MSPTLEIKPAGENSFDMGIDLLKGLKYFPPIHSRHHHIKKDQIYGFPLFPVDIDSLFPARRELCSVTQNIEILNEHLYECSMVVHKENG